MIARHAAILDQSARSRHRLIPKPILRTPFYAAPVCAGITHTMGGIITDDNAQVLTPSGATIAGLYAAGASTGGIEGGDKVGYVGGLIKAAVMSLRAGEAIARSDDLGWRSKESINRNL